MTMQDMSQFNLQQAFGVFQEILAAWPMWNSQFRVAAGRSREGNEMAVSLSINVCFYHMDRDTLIKIIDIADKHNMSVGFPNGEMVLRPKEKGEPVLNDN